MISLFKVCSCCKVWSCYKAHAYCNLTYCYIGDAKSVEKLMSIDQCDELERQLKATLDVVDYRKQQIVKLGK